MRNMSYLVLLSFVISILCSCTISGTITDEEGEPLPGITVSLSGPLNLKTITDEAGHYTFSHQQIIDGDFTVTPSSGVCQFVPEFHEVRVKSQGVSGVDFEGACINIPIETVRSELKRDTTPDITPKDVESLVAGNTDFALKIYQKLRTSQPGNLFYSPYSISTALAMLYGGARGNTATQMSACLNFNLPSETVHSGFNYLDLELSGRTKIPIDSETPEEKFDIFKLNISNAIWLQEGYPVLPTYLDSLALNYGAGIYLLDFMSDPDPCRLTVNDWVARQTENRIQNLLPEGSINQLTRFVLTNTIYFNARWIHPFKEENTKNEPFYPLSQSAVTTAMMHQTGYFRYATGGNFQAVELPYWSDQQALAMLVIVPHAGQFEAFEAALSDDQIAAINRQLQSTYIDLTMPKWQYRSSFSLKEILGDLGIADLFIPELADLSGINGFHELYATDVFHEAFVKVNEAGTEAAAATGIPGGGGVPPVPEVVKIDRPFIFLIHDRLSRTVIFSGRVVDPR